MSAGKKKKLHKIESREHNTKCWIQGELTIPNLKSQNTKQLWKNCNDIPLSYDEYIDISGDKSIMWDKIENDNGNI